MSVPNLCYCICLHYVQRNNFTFTFTTLWDGPNFVIVWYGLRLLVPVAAQSKAQVFGRSPAEIVGSNPTGSMDVCLL